jgi:hypothetical protein
MVNGCEYDLGKVAVGIGELDAIYAAIGPVDE